MANHQLDILWNSWRNERDSASADDKGRGVLEWVGQMMTKLIM